MLLHPSLLLSAFVGLQFPPEVILLSVRCYLRFGLSHRDLEELLAERGIEVDHLRCAPGRVETSEHSPCPDTSTLYANGSLDLPGIGGSSEPSPSCSPSTSSAARQAAKPTCPTAG